MNNLKEELDSIDNKKSSKFSFKAFLLIIVFILTVFILFSFVNYANKRNFEQSSNQQVKINNELLENNERLLDKIDELEKDHNNYVSNSKKEINDLKKRLKDSKENISILKKRINDKEEIIQSLNSKLNKKILSDKSNNVLTDDLTIQETDLDNFDNWKTSPPPTSTPQVKFIPYDDPPKPLYPIKPVYPNLAQKAGVEGQVLIQCFIDKNGVVKETIILKGIPNSGLNESAINAIKEARFRPAKQRGKKVGVWITIPINFELRN